MGKKIDREYMRALTLHQPWASFITDGLKTIETRLHDHFSILENHRIVIHAGKKWDPNAFEIFTRPEFGQKGLFKHHLERIYWKNNIPLGAVVCTAMVQKHRLATPEDSIDACIEIEPGERRFALVLRDVQPLEIPITYPGNQGIWKFDKNLFTEEYRSNAVSQLTLF
jgi:hypothetical protein